LRRPFQDCNAEDIVRYVAQLADKGVSQSTRAFRIIVIRKLMKFLGKQDVYKAVKLPRVQRKLPEVLTEEEVRRMVEAAESDRDKALIQVLYESGCRLGELVGLRVRDVQFDQYGAKLLVRGKTGDRPIRLIHSVPALQHWLEHHKLKADPDAPLFYTTGGPKNAIGQPLSSQALQAILQRVARKAGIKKRVYCHLFRHSRFTHLSRQLTDTELMVLAGWKTRSMCDVYNHLSMRDVEDKLLKIHGVLPEERPQESPLAPRRCPRCRETNPATNRFCSRCGLALDAKVAMRLEEETRKRDEKLAKLLEDPEVRALLIRKLAELD
jgi:integrase